MKTRNFTIAQEDLEIFERAVEFKEFFELSIIKCQEFISLEEMKKALKKTEENSIKSDFFSVFDSSDMCSKDIFDTYEKICKGINNFRKRGAFSKEFKRVFKREVGDGEFYAGLKWHIIVIRNETLQELYKKIGGKGCGSVVQKLIEFKRENEKEVKIPFYKRTILQPCGWALLVAAIFLYVMKVH